MLNRMWRAARLDASLYEEVEADSKATGQAMVVVVLSSLATGIGGLTEGGVVGLLVGIGMGLLGWGLWAYLNYLIGGRLWKEAQTHADWGQLARVMGFASTPRLISVLALVPVPAFRFLVYLVATIWTWIAMVIAVRQALDYKSTLRAVVVTGLGWLVNAIVLTLVQVVLIDTLFGG
ncbi:MAG: YIP1 family protein [Dehalococcoidia bacterium]|nr:YIP1 family protein [Dehalococcoidia bacterium]